MGSGTGANGAGTPVNTATDTRPGGGLGNPIDPQGTNDPWAKYKWWIIGGLGLVLAAGGGIMLRGGTGAAAAAATGPGGTGAGGLRDDAVMAGGGSSTMRALRDELFALETERLQGKLAEPEYLEQKAALETVLRRALGRSEATADAPKSSAV